MSTNLVPFELEKNQVPHSNKDPIVPAWENVICRGCPPEHAVRPEVLDSWLECREIGLDPISKAPPLPILSEEKLKNLIAKNKLLIDVCRPIINMVEIIVRGTGFVASLTERHGYVMLFCGNGNILQMAEGNYFMPGCLRTTEHAGTNAIGLCLKTVTPIQITGAEHYKKPFHSWTCSAAPIHDSQNRILGVINLSGQYMGSNKHTLALVTAAAETINTQLRERDLIEEKETLNLILTRIFDSISDSMIAIDNRMRILNMNRSAAQMLDLKEPVIGIRMDELVREKDPLINTIRSRNHSPLEMTFINPRDETSYLCRIDPVLNSNGKRSGAILKLTRKHEKIKPAKKIGGNVARFDFADIKGRNVEFRRQIELAKVAAKTSSRVLITGESGTGKELFAQAIHNFSKRKREPFVAISCAAIPRDLIESELFGYRGGAFTGARREGMVGKFELANRGTLFLDEINGLPWELQGKLLRALQQNEIVRLADSQPIPVNVRVIAAGNSDLALEVENRNFREDLYYRLNVIEINIPPLRQRMDDLPLLIEHITERQSKEMGIEKPVLTEEVLATLEAYPWPGNIRELENCIECAMIISQCNQIDSSSLPLRIRRSAPFVENRSSTKPLDQALREMITACLKRCEGNISLAARELKISRSTLYRKMKDIKLP